MDAPSESSHPSPKQKRPQESPSKSPTSKHLKTLESQNSSPSPTSSKGKSKSEEHESEFDCCGICLYEEGKAVRGWIDSCDHYFCFVCIMEWAKVESRCPICKRRFAAIRRPPKDGIFLSERIVNVPVRDQVNHCFANGTVGPQNPYSEVQCSECHSEKDENLLLLCDLCDSAAHTYCVGLGFTVPEGDWFCQDCTHLRDEHTKNNADLNFGSHTSFGSFTTAQSAEAHVSISSIVRESSIHEHDRPSIAVCSSQNQLSSPIVPDGPSVAETVEVSRTKPIVGNTSTELGARTLRRCRNVHARVRALRENWNAFRSGALSFSSNSGDKINTAPSQESTSQKDSSCNVLPNRGSYDVDRAWKMMDAAAKSITRNGRRIRTGCQISKDPIRKVNNQKESGKINSKLITTNSKQLGNKDDGICGSKKQYFCLSHENDDSRFKHQMFEKEKPREGKEKGIPKVHECSPINSLRGKEFPSSREVHTSFRVHSYLGNGEKQAQENFLQAPSNVSNENDGPSCLISAVGSPVVNYEVPRAKQELQAFYSTKGKDKRRMEKDFGDSKLRKADDAKSEIQSLVKLNLKLIGKKLGMTVISELMSSIYACVSTGCCNI